MSVSCTSVSLMPRMDQSISTLPQTPTPAPAPVATETNNLAASPTSNFGDLEQSSLFLPSVASTTEKRPRSPDSETSIDIGRPPLRKKFYRVKNTEDQYSHSSDDGDCSGSFVSPRKPVSPAVLTPPPPVSPVRPRRSKRSKKIPPAL